MPQHARNERKSWVVVSDFDGNVLFNVSAAIREAALEEALGSLGYNLREAVDCEEGEDDGK